MHRCAAVQGSTHIFLNYVISLCLGILHDVEATDKSIAAGGKNSVKGEFGVSDPYATPGARKASAAELVQKIDKIERISLKVTGGPCWRRTDVSL